MKYFGRYAWRAILFIVLSLSVNSAIEAQVKEQENLNSLIAEHLKNSDYKFKKISETAWIIENNGETLLVAAQPEYFLVGIVIAKKDQFKMSVESLSEVLKLAHVLDFVKIGIDKDGDLFVRMERKSKTLEKQEFYNYITLVTEAAQKAKFRLEPFFVKEEKNSV